MKQILVSSAVTILFILIITGCNNTASSEKTTEHRHDTLDAASMRKIVEERNLAYNNAFVQGDSITAMDHFTEDASLFAPNSEQLIGKAAFAPLLSQFLKFGIKKFTDETTKVMAAGEYIIEEGNYFLGGADGSTIDKGKYLCVWRKENGVWRVCSNMWNTSIPAAVEKK
jgi:ketosteroid isomerase-like protein